MKLEVVLCASLFCISKLYFAYSLFPLSLLIPFLGHNTIVSLQLLLFIFLIPSQFLLSHIELYFNSLCSPSLYFLIPCSTLNDLINSLGYFEFMTMILAKIFICLLAIFSPSDYGFVLLFVFPISFFLKH